MSRIRSRETKLPGSYTPTTQKTERSATALLMHWMREIIEKNQLDLGPPDVEAIGDDRKMPDLEVYESQRSRHVLCVIEAKPPRYDVYDDKELKEPARQKATRRGAKHFAVTNFQELLWYDTASVNALKREQELLGSYSLSKIVDLNVIEHPRYSDQIKRNLSLFLSQLYRVHSGREPKPLLAIDERLIRTLHYKVHRLGRYYEAIIDDQLHKDKAFYRKLRNWFNSQGWSFARSDRDLEKASRQAAYLLLNKILFYMVLQTKKPQVLSPLDLQPSVEDGLLLRNILQSYFNVVLEKIDYEEIYKKTDFIDEIAIPDSKEVVAEIKSTVAILGRYDFAKLNFEILGRIFEKLIPAEERHILGQYFTNSDVVDVILSFCHEYEDDLILDPACGAGTFLVRAYQHKKNLNFRKSHEEILATLWGNDIAKFPAHLSTINLAIRDLSVDKNYPNILHKDFFSIKVGKEGCDLDSWRDLRAKTLGKEKREITYPRYFDAVVGNPPYTRQEELVKISKEYGARKEHLITNSLLDVSGRKPLANLSKRAGIHAYFFVHGYKFLKEGGHFGFVVSNSWLDVGYGAGLQEFFLKNYKIVCILESKVERWFADADVNTCIVILRKCSDKKQRDENLCRFVYLKKPLGGADGLVPPAQESHKNQVHRFQEIDKLKKTLLAHNEFYENDDWRIFPISQADLWKEGYDADEAAYVGAKWGKYLRAPKIFFTILEKGKGKLVPLKELAKVRRGFTTGANEFFYLTEWEAMRKQIEPRFLQPIIFSLKEIETYRVDRSKLKKRAIICWQEREKLYGTKLFEYIKRGEKKDYQNRPTCASRSPWYALGKNWDYAPLIFPAKVGERMPVFLNDDVYEDKKLYGITPKEKENIFVLAGLLNSTLIRFFIEFTCRQLTGAQAIADIDVIVVKNLALPSPSSISKRIANRIGAAFESLSHDKSEGVFREVAPSSAAVSPEEVKPDRRALDQIIMGDILGLTEEEQLEVYRAVVDLVRSRLDKAKSVESANNEDQGELEGAADTIWNSVKGADDGRVS